jgi:hypothetical protein
VKVCGYLAQCGQRVRRFEPIGLDAAIPAQPSNPEAVHRAGRNAIEAHDAEPMGVLVQGALGVGT